jgi:hypothetical protein
MKVRDRSCIRFTGPPELLNKTKVHRERDWLVPVMEVSKLKSKDESVKTPENDVPPMARGVEGKIASVLLEA